MWMKTASVSALLCIVACGSKTPSESEHLLRSFECEQPLLEFTLGYDSNPSDSQLAELCDCIWNALPVGAKEVSEELRDGKQPSDSAAISSYTDAFSSAVEGCGGYES